MMGECNRVDFTTSLPNLTLVSSKKLVAMPGLKTTDAVYICARSDLPLAMDINNARCSAPDVLELRVSTSTVLGLNDNTSYDFTAIIYPGAL